jgi:heme/copper-type cytochrome/quinol oxidase subunit 3
MSATTADTTPSPTPTPTPSPTAAPGATTSDELVAESRGDARTAVVPGSRLPSGTTLTGTLLLIAADAMVLLALLATWWTIKGGAPAWPPRGVSVGTYLPTTVTITAIMSAFAVQWAVSAIRRNDQRSGTVALILTVFFALAIANAQWYYLIRARFGLDTHNYGTLFHLLIGYHLLHVVLATAALVLVGTRAMAGHFGRHGHDPLRSAAAFFQYSNAAWFAILTVMFLFSKHA